MPNFNHSYSACMPPPRDSDHSATNIFLIGFVCLVIFALTGCSISRLAPGSEPATAVHLNGHVHGGQQPVSASTIQLYTAGANGNASTATPMLTTTVLTDSNGGFNITGDYTCPSPTSQVYITATGGNPGLNGPVNNASLAMVTALGDCGNLSSASFISLNEVTTAAAAWALAPFATSITNVGSSSTNNAGLRNAMLTAMNLADSSSGISPAASLPTNASIESSKLYTLANILAACVNSDGTLICPSLFADATPPSGSAPNDTFQMALTVVSNPSNNVATLFNDMPAQSAFGNALPQAPNDWTMSISYTGGGLDNPAKIAIDASGNIWVSDFSNGTISSFTPQGSPTWASGITGSGLEASIGIAIDPSSNVWIANETGPANPNGSVIELNSSGTALSGANGLTAGGISTPVAIAAAPNGSIWIGNSGQSAVTLFDNSGSPLSGVNGYGAGLLALPSAIALDASSNAWIANQGSGALVNIDPAGNVLANIPCCGNPDSIAIDSAGTIWLSDSTNNLLTPVSAGITGTSITANLNVPSGIAIDGLDRLWITNWISNSLTEITGTNSPGGAGNFLSPSTGLGLDAQLNQPRSAALDASGNLWVTSSGDNRLIAFVGLATPVQTPQIGLPQQP